MSKTQYNNITKMENNFNMSVASLGDIYHNILHPQKDISKKYDILSEEELKNRGITNVNLNRANLGYQDKIYSKEAGMNQKQKGFKGKKLVGNGKKVGSITKGKNEIELAKEEEFNKNNIIDVNYLHMTKLPESKKFCHVDKGVINPVQSDFSVKDIVDKKLKNHEKMMKPIVLYPDRVKIYNEQPEKILPGQLRNQNERKISPNKKSLNNMMVIGSSPNKKNNTFNSHVVFPDMDDKKAKKTFKNKYDPLQRFRPKSTRGARKTLQDSENFVGALDNYFLSNNMKVPSKYNMNQILNEYANRLNHSLEKFLGETEGKTKPRQVVSNKIYPDKGKFKQKKWEKIYPEIDDDYQRKIQEKLSRLQLSLREIFDNISILKENKGNKKKIEEMIAKAKKLTGMIKILANDISEGEKRMKDQSKKNSRPKTKSEPKKEDKNIIPSETFNNSMSNFSKTFNKANKNIKRSQTMPHGFFNYDDNSSMETVKNSKMDQLLKSTGFNPIIEESQQINNINTSISMSKNQINNNNKTNNDKPNANFKINTNVSQSTIANYDPNKIPKTNQISTQNCNTFSNKKIVNTNNNKLSISQSNFFLKSSNEFKEELKDQNQINNYITGKEALKNSTYNDGFINTLNNSLSNSKILAASLDSFNKLNQRVNPNYLANKTNALMKSGVVNDLSQTMNHMPLPLEEMKVNTQNYVQDERYSVFNLELPIQYYYELSKENEPSYDKNKDWCIRPHHTETFVDSKKTLPDDILNTKYISYYGENKDEFKEKTRQEILEELITETRGKIEELQKDMFLKSNKDANYRNIYNNIINNDELKQNAQKTFDPNYRENKEKKQKSIFEMLKDPNVGSFTNFNDMYNQNEEIKQTNFAIDVYNDMLGDLRNKEQVILNQKRIQEYERIRPPVKKWYELKSDAFQNELNRNVMVLHSGPEYFKKIEDLQDDELY